MSKIKTAFELITKKDNNRALQKAIADNITKMDMLQNLSDEAYLKLVYRLIFGRKLDLKNPKTFNEKLQWLKLYNRKPEYTLMVDKYEVKGYIAEQIGEEYVIPTLGVWDNFDDIDFDSLPNQFVLKCTHDSGGLVICKDKSNLDVTKAREKINKALTRRFYYFGREWPYKNVKPRIIAEKYMVDKTVDELRDYKLFCFNGEPKVTLVCSGRFSEGGLREDFFDEQWNHISIKRPGHPNENTVIPKPINFEQMKMLAHQLFKSIPFLRVDFYEIDGKLYFGELTFYPASGFEEFEPNKWDYEMGEWIHLPERRMK